MDCEHGNCHQPTIPGTRRLHRHLHETVPWYRDWHHHPLRPHAHISVLIVSVLILGMVVLTPSKTGLKAEIVGMPIAGRLIDASGQPIRDGSHSAVFRLYPVEQGGVAQWTEVHEGEHRLLTVNGFYTVELGRLSRFTLTDIATQEYLGVAVDGGAELSPRLLVDPVALGSLE
ncbi:MAG: hypothetical protein AAB701_01720 [Patescibacteria group bacterium]